MMTDTRARRVRIAYLALLTLVIAGSLASQYANAQEPAERPVLRILFIGNSYTFVNNLGDILAGIAAADPSGPTVSPTLVTYGGATLKWHLDNGSAAGLLQTGSWDFVVLQEQSLLGGGIVDGVTTVGDPTEFFEAVREWVGRIRSVGARPILFMTWARQESTREATRVQAAIADAYETVGHELNVMVAPVGLAWAECRRRLLSLDLYMYDGSHPNSLGSYLTGLVIYTVITGNDPKGAPSIIMGRPAVRSEDGEAVIDAAVLVPLVDLRETTAAALQEIAWYTVSVQLE